MRRFRMVLSLFVLVGSLSAVLYSAEASVRPRPSSVQLDTDRPPPSEPVFEVIPGERQGYAWVNGYWDWDGSRHVWRPGRWIETRAGYVWVAETWAQRGKKWRLYPGRWERDLAEDTELEVVTNDDELDVASLAPDKKPVKKQLRKSPPKSAAYRMYKRNHPHRR